MEPQDLWGFMDCNTQLYTHKTKGAFGGHMAPSAPSRAPLRLYVCSHNGSNWSYITHTL